MRIIVLGCGRIGIGLARELQNRDVHVTAVDHDPGALAGLGAAFAGDRILGSIDRRGTFEHAHAEDADAMAAVTGDDALNAIIALHGRRTFHIPLVVARLDDPRRAQITQRLGIRTITPVTWGVQRLADLLLPGDAHVSASLGTGAVDLLELRVPAVLDGHPASELRATGECHVVAVTHHGRTVLATDATPLYRGDLVHVAIAHASRGRLEALLGSGGAR